MDEKDSAYQRGLLHGILIVLGIVAALVLIWALSMGGMMSRMMGW